MISHVLELSSQSRIGRDDRGSHLISLRLGIVRIFFQTVRLIAGYFVNMPALI